MGNSIEILDILIILIIIGVIYLWYKNQSNKNIKSNNEKFDAVRSKNLSLNLLLDTNKHKNKIKSKNKKKYYNILNNNKNDDKNNKNINNIEEMLSRIEIGCQYELIKPYFMEMQFHNDYRDTIAAINDLTNNRREKYNDCNMPVIHTKPPLEEISEIVNEFIEKLNHDITNNVSEYRSCNNGWDEPIPDYKEKSGWEKQQEELGLPSSLYSDPAKKSKIELIKITDIEKYETKSEIRYICTIIIQKINVDDQMILKLSFIKNNTKTNKKLYILNDLNSDNIYDKESKEPLEIIIEEIFVVGFLTDEGLPNDNKHEDFYDFKGLNYNDVINNKTIIKELIKKYNNRTRENLNFTACLDESSRIFHNELRDIITSNSYQCTRSIYDDLNNNKILYE